MFKNKIYLKMNESYDHEQSMSVKRASKKIRKVKIRYIKLTIFLLIINFIALIIQKYPEFTNGNKNEITRKNIFLIFEDLGLKIVIIISFLKYKMDSIILCSILYFIIASIMIFYIILNKFSSSIKDEQKIEDLSIIMFISNIVLFILEGFLMVKCAQLMRKEQREKVKEKYGFKTGDDLLRSKNVLTENTYWLIIIWYI